MSAVACEESEELDEVCEFLDDEPLVATAPVAAQWWNQPDPAAEARARAIVDARRSSATGKVQCCVCLTATDIAKMATYLPCGHCVVCAGCFGQLRLRDLAAERDTFCPTCRALVTSTLKVFV
jgi:hypothetical protein